jgi:hypothetical protein
MSHTLTFSHTSSELEATIFPPIHLDDGKYEVGLLSFDSYNSIPNVDERNNKVHFGDGEVAEIPTGSYELKDIFEKMQSLVKEHNHVFSFTSSINTFTATIKCDVDIDFSKPNSVGPLLGFHPRVLRAHQKHYSDFVVDIFRVDVIDIHCSIAGGSYMNGKPTHSVHAFSLQVGPGFKIREKPSEVIYHPVRTNVLDKVYLKVVDQDGKIVNFRNERVTIRLHVRRVKV